MRKLLYIISLFLVVACVNDPFEGVDTLLTGDPKVEIDFTVQVQDPSVATRALAQNPTLRNLMVAVFDASGYLLEYTYAIGDTQYATENGVRYKYNVALTQSDEPRIIHFIGNAPDKLAFGVEETVLADITSSIGKYADDGIYWCRREIPKISGTQSGADGDETSPNTPIYQADIQTRAYFDNVGLIRNFSQIQLVSSTSDFTLEKYYVVGTPKEGLAAAYNYSSGEFVNYYEGTDISGSEDTGYTFNLGDAKTFAEIIAEGYNANVLPTAPRFTLAEYASNWINNGASAYVYECEKPLRAEDAVYIIAYGKYKDNKNYYYKIDLRDKNGYFPIIRNFKYTVNIKAVTRPGYDSVEKAAASAGSGDISTSLETMSLAYISDGVASLEVEYIEKYIVNPGNVPLGYKFLDDVNTSHAGDPTKMWVVVNEAGATGAAITAINGKGYTVGQSISVSQNPGTLTITPTALTDVPKSQTLTIFAEYTNGDASHILQRTVNFIVQSKRTMVVSLNPSEVPAEAGSEFDVNISLPAGLSESIFPLEFLIESGSLSINPHNDHMPVRSGFSLVDNKKSSFYFVKTFEYEDYNPESGAINIVDCHFKTIKDQAATHIYAANPYFNTVYDYQGTVSNLDADGHSVYLDTYDAETFSSLSFSSGSVGVGENQRVDFSFNMSKIPENREVYVALGNLMPAASETQLEYYGLEGNKAVYIFRPQNTSGTFQLQTAHFDDELSVDLSAYKFKPATKSVGRSLYHFDGSFSKPALSGTAEQVSYTFYVPYYYEGMVIEVEMKGLAFNEGKLPADWENWRDLGNDVYAVQYKPSGFLNAVTMNLITDINDISEPCTITVQSQGYETESNSIYAGFVIPELSVVFTWDHSNDPDDDFVENNIQFNSTANIQINGDITTSHNNASDRVYTTVMKNVVIANADRNTTITISYTGSSTYNTYTYSKTTTVGNLLDSPSVTLEEE